jgi:GGDEF domain-containing protein
VVYPEQGDDREKLFRQADAGMYAAKRRGARAASEATSRAAPP